MLNRTLVEVTIADTSTPKWWEDGVRRNEVPQDLLPDWLRALARDSHNQDPIKQAAFLQAARRIEDLEALDRDRVNSTMCWRHADGTIRVDHMDSRPGDYFGSAVYGDAP